MDENPKPLEGLDREAALLYLQHLGEQALASLDAQEAGDETT